MPRGNNTHARSLIFTRSSHIAPDQVPNYNSGLVQEFLDRSLKTINVHAGELEDGYTLDYDHTKLFPDLVKIQEGIKETTFNYTKQAKQVDSLLEKVLNLLCEDYEGKGELTAEAIVKYLNNLYGQLNSLRLFEESRAN